MWKRRGIWRGGWIGFLGCERIEMLRPMDLSRRDILATRACRVILRDQRYSPARTRALIEWLKSEFVPTSDIAARALAKLGRQAFDDLLADVLSGSGLPKASVVWALELFPEEHERLLPLLREWIGGSGDDLRRQIAVSIAHVLTERLNRRLPVEPADVALFKTVLIPAASDHGGIRVCLRDFERAASEASG
jgi:hypothetical protein